MRRVEAFVAALALGSGAFSTGCLARDVWYNVPEYLAKPVLRRSVKHTVVNRPSVLFVIDDSPSMGDKQALLAKAIERTQGVIWSCVGADGPVDLVDGVCPDDTAWTGVGAFGQVALITTSLEAGGKLCAERSRGALPLPRSIDEFSGASLNVGEEGCGFEAPLEATYRFLVDPEPPLGVSVRSGEAGDETTAEGTHTELLAERADFLAPHSFITIVILTDEDDCSVMDSGDAWKIGEAEMARGTSVCASDPEDPCCRPCDALEEAPPPGCAPLTQDPNCQAPLFARGEAPINTRCWNQKARFGQEWLFPIERYTEALTSPFIRSRRGALVENPLFVHGETPDMVSVLLLSGVPWQLLTKPESHPEDEALSFLTPSELEANGVWAKILGLAGAVPTDPHLVQSVSPRAGLPLAETTWDPVHGHEVSWPGQDNLQFSCIFPLPEPRTCEGKNGCGCDRGVKSPLCEQEDGSYGQPQRFAGAFPPTRLAQFARSLGERATLGSICPKQLSDPGKPGYGYDDFISQTLRERFNSFHKPCFTPTLPTNPDGSANCKLLEYYESPGVDCAALGRFSVDDEYRKPFKLTKDDLGTLCEIPRMPGDPADPQSDYYRCAHDLHPAVTNKGYCYIDTLIGLGSPELVAVCSETHKRFLRSIPAALGRPGTKVGLVCDYRR